MGLTIFFKGSVSNREKIKDIIEDSKIFSMKFGWNFENVKTESFDGIVIYPHECCEAMSIIFDHSLKMDGYTKTQFAPEEIHVEIVKLFINIKKYFKKLSIVDETGLWDEYIEKTKKTPSKTFNLIELTTAQMQELNQGFIKNKDENYGEEWFWNNDFDDVSDLNFPILRDLMRKDLSQERSNLIKLSEIFEIMGNKEELSSLTPELAFITLVKLWILKSTSGEKNKINKAMALGFLLAEGIYGFHGGYFDQRHRRASAYLKDYISEFNAKSTIMTLRFLYTILDYYNLKRIYDSV
ncbi:hypothetical protein FDB15_12850 [Clostridium botulinum]|uniref:hypothetical protein n=1 Tax=unclassified Clostridium TaxID=2614128 RepID=UPI0004FFC4AB|nr:MULTISPECIES: hypothetical protein [unclassified Clostridium]KFX55329.1 hypothetical protein KU40_08910 [Clostridium botulinum]MBY6777835.1 hypothetical protein [Clostridium botulinum]MBY6851258.1 hypothetical protein [Clostridium botulinum]MBY7008645.1 hypothetical protein [Clostridium botulinum]NFF24112.1 hypothetical protein [Clostridium botulinum]